MKGEKRLQKGFQGNLGLGGWKKAVGEHVSCIWTGKGNLEIITGSSQSMILRGGGLKKHTSGFLTDIRIKSQSRSGRGGEHFCKGLLRSRAASLVLTCARTENSGSLDSLTAAAATTKKTLVFMLKQVLPRRALFLPALQGTGVESL